MMTVSYEAKAYSRGRTTVMGIAAAMIVWFHAEYPLQAGTAAEFVKLICDIGVDLFLLASGVGMYFAMEKHGSYRSFLLSRLRRILPVYLLVSVPWFVYLELHWGTRDWGNCLMNISTLSFWLKGDLTCWYVAGILVLYLVTPLYGRLWKRWDRLNALVIAGWYAVLIPMLLGWLPDIFGSATLLAARIPVYLLGLSLGRAVKEERTFRVSLPAAVLAAGVSLFLIASAFGRTGLQLNWFFKYLAYGPLAVLLSLGLARIPGTKAVDFLGRHSLEIYLLFEKMQNWLADQPWMFAVMERSDAVRPLLALALALVGAWILQGVCNALFRRGGSGRLLDKTPAGK